MDQEQREDILELIMVSYMVVGGKLQATQVYVGLDCPDKVYLKVQ